MNQAWLKAAVVKASEHVRRGAEIVAEGREAVARAKAAGRDPTEARARLDTVERSQALFVADLAYFKKQLANAEAG